MLIDHVSNRITTPTLLHHREDAVEMFDVAVIGAGMAGITAARDLSKNGFSVVLLEARDRVGGRTYVKKALGDIIELGGAYVHWTQPHVWHELQMHAIGLLPPLSTSNAYWLADGKMHCGTEEEYYEASVPQWHNSLPTPAGS